MKTINKITIAAVLAATMGTAAALTVPGMPAGTDFEFNGANASSNSAITNITDILTAVSGEGAGTNIDQAAFWNSFISDAPVKVFYYTQAEDYIEELIFTVEGKARMMNGNYADASQFDFTGKLDSDANFVSAKDTLEAKVSAQGNNYKDGELKITGDNAMALLTKLGFVTSQNGNGNLMTQDGVVTELVSGGKTGATVATELLADKTQSGTAGSGFIASVVGAKVDDVSFARANQLIDLISKQLRNGYILDTANATSAVAQIVEHHNAFLGASIVDKAKSLKAVIKNIGLQTAASVVTQGLGAVCTEGAVITDVVTGAATACVDMAQKVVDINAKTILVGKADSDFGLKTAQDYNDALDVIDAFADNLIAFNSDSLAGNYGTGSAANDSISAQFGTITVREVDSTDSDYATSIYGQLVTAGTNPFAFSDWADDAIDLDGFTEAFTLDLFTFDTDGNLIEDNNGDAVLDLDVAAGNLR